MSDLQTSLVVNLAGNLNQRAKRYGDALKNMGQHGQRHMRLLDSSIRSVGKGLDMLGNRYTAVLSGAGFAVAARQVATLQTRFTRLGIQAGRTDAQMAKLKQTIFDVAQEREIRVDPAQITSAIESIVEKTGDLKFAQDNIRNIGMAIQATGADGQAIGEILGEFQKMGLVDPSNVMQVMDVLNVQGKEGAFTLQNLAALGPRVITAYTATGRSGAEAMREMGAALQMIRMGTGSSEMAATAFEATMRTLTDPKKIKLLQQAGIAIYDPVAAQNGKKSLRPINELMAEIIKRVDGDASQLGTIFDAEAVRAFNAAASEFQRTGSLDTLQKFMDVQADGSTTMGDAARAAQTADAALENLLTAWKQFQDNELSGPIQDVADALNSLEPGAVQQWLQVAKTLAIVGAGAIALRKAGQAYSWVKGIQNGATTGGIGGALKGAAGAGFGGAQPVYVVNMPGGGFDTNGSSKKSGAKPGGRSVNSALGYNPKKTPPPSRWSKLLGKLTGTVGAAGLGTAAAGVTAAGATGYGVGTLIHQSILKGTETEMDIGRAIAKALAFVGNDNAQAALDAEQRAQAQLNVSIEDNRVRITQLDTIGVDVDVSGQSMGGIR